MNLLFCIAVLLFIEKVQNQELPVIQKLPETMNLVAGQKFKIVCPLASGSTPVDFVWTKNNKSILVDSNISFDNRLEESILKIVAIKPEDAGSYRCNVRNSAGSDSNLVQVIVKGK